MRDKAADTCPFVFGSVPGQVMAQEMCDKVISEEPFLLKYCPDRYKTQKMCNKAFDSYPLALKFDPDWLFANKMLEKLDNGVFSNNNIKFGNKNSNIVALFSSDIGQ